MAIGKPNRRQASRGWFNTGNVILDHFGTQLGPVGIAVYVAIARRTGSNESAFPSYRDIAHLAGIERATAIRTVKKLVALGLLGVTKRSGPGGNTSNLYRLTDIKDLAARVDASVPSGGGDGSPDSRAGSPDLVADGNRPGGADPPEESYVKKTSHKKTAVQDARTPKNDGERAHTGRSQDAEPLAVPGYTQDFNSVWWWYPKKMNKAAAFAEWQRLHVDDNNALLCEIFIAIYMQREQEQWQEEERYIPNFDSWLRNRRWEDDVDVDDEDELREQARKLLVPQSRDSENRSTEAADDGNAAGHSSSETGQHDQDVPGAGADTEYRPTFEEVWAEYPGNFNEKLAHEAWQDLGADRNAGLARDILVAILWQREQPSWRQRPRTIRHMHYWLLDAFWQDEPQTPEMQQLQQRAYRLVNNIPGEDERDGDP